MIASDDELTVQREVEWPKEHPPRAARTSEPQPAHGTEAIATEIFREALPARRPAAHAPAARVTTQATRARGTAAQLSGRKPSARVIAKLQLAGALLLGAVLASSVSLLAARDSAPPAAPSSIASTTPVARASEPAPRAPAAELPAAVAPAQAVHAEPASAWTPSTAAAALARNEYDLALRAYRALAELYPRSAVYRVITDVLARKLVHHCDEGAPCRAK